MIGYACRYGGESMADLTTALSKAHGVPAQHIMLAAGSGEILRAVTLAFTGPGRALVVGGTDVRVAGPHRPGR